MTNSEKKHYNKKFMPPYMQKWNIAMAVMTLVWFVGFVVAFIVSAFVVPEQNLTPIIAIAFLIVLIVLCIVIVAVQVTFNKKLINQRKQELEKEYHGITKIIIAQRIASVKNADRIAVLEHGKIAACDTHKNLLTYSEIYRDIYESQLKTGGNSDE